MGPLCTQLSLALQDLGKDGTCVMPCMMGWVLAIMFQPLFDV